MFEYCYKKVLWGGGLGGFWVFVVGFVFCWGGGGWGFLFGFGVGGLVFFKFCFLEDHSFLCEGLFLVKE